MGEVKGAGVVYLRSQLKAKGPDILAAFLKQLTPDEQKRFNSVIHISKIPIDFAIKLVNSAAPLLYPKLSPEKASWQYNYDMAQDQMNGVYKVILRFATPEFVISQAAKVWSTIHSDGHVQCIEHRDIFSAEFILLDYPHIPKSFLPMVSAYLVGILELTGVKNTKVNTDFSNNQKWIWYVSWDKK